MDIIFSVIMAVAIIAVLVNELYAHKLKVSAMPTLPWTRTQILDLMDAYMSDEVMSIYDAWIRLGRDG